MAVQPLQSLALDKGNETGFIRFFLDMPQKPTTTVRLFDRSEYYTAHGEDALLAARLVFHTNSVVKELGSGEYKVPSVVLSKLNFEVLVRELLLVVRYRVEVYSSHGRYGNDWSLSYKASPGNLQQLEEVVFAGADVLQSSVVMAVRLSPCTQAGRRVGVASADLTSCSLRVAEFSDNDQLSELQVGVAKGVGSLQGCGFLPLLFQSCMVQMCPRECILCSSDTRSEAGRLRQMLSRCNMLITDKKKADFSSKDIVQDLNRLLKLESGSSCSTLPQLDLLLAMECVAALISYLELLSDESSFASYQLLSLDLDHHLRLDTAAATALGVGPAEGDPSSSSSSSLLGVLNKCRMAEGQRLLHQWVQQPLVDKGSIEERLNLVEVFFSDTVLRANLQLQLSHMPDFHRLARKMKAGKGILQDVVRLYQALQRLPDMLASLKAYAGCHTSLLGEVVATPLFELNQDFSKFLQLVESTVDLDLIQQHQFLLKPSMDESLQQLHGEMEEVEEEIRVVFQQAASELGLEPHKTIKLESNAQLGHFLRVTKKVEKCLRGQRRYSVLETRNDGVRFTTGRLRSLSQQHQGLQESYERQQASLAGEVMAVATGYTDPLECLGQLLARLDVLVSFAHVSASAPVPYVRPTIFAKGEGDIILQSCRHPCLEMQDDIAFIPNDAHLLRGQDMFQIITGPNMGGKSTYIRQVGVVVLLAQLGCFVPCARAEVAVVDRILARVGAGDSQVKGVSTFMAEMLETAAILNMASENSLVIIDELGRGTSTYDGFGLAWAIAEHIATKIRCFCLFATHFHEMTTLAHVVPTVSNRHVTALTSGEALTLLYRVQPGVCDQSFGIHVAEMAHFPAKVVEFARQKAAELETCHRPVAIAPITKRPCLEGNLAREVESHDAEREEEKKVDEFLSSVSSLPLDKMTDEEVRLKLSHLVEELKASSSPYLSSLISS